MIQDHERLADGEDGWPGMQSNCEIETVSHDSMVQATVSFSVECQSTSLGEAVGIVGGCAELGSWTNAVAMSADDWPIWKVSKTLCVCTRSCACV